jgi:chemotaxis protein CheX
MAEKTGAEKTEMATAAGRAKTIDAGKFEIFLDRATDEVFSTMIGVSCRPSAAEAGAGESSISAVIGLAGAMSGTMVLHASSVGAMRIAERMTGMAPEGVDAMVRDAVGEVCNMIAGAWKGFDPALASGCLLSTPTVVAGSSYELFSQRAPVRIERRYSFEELSLTVTIFCELPA